MAQAPTLNIGQQQLHREGNEQTFIGAIGFCYCWIINVVSLGTSHTNTLSAQKASIAREPMSKVKVTLHYDEPDNEDLHTSLKITLPKKWAAGPTDKIRDVSEV